MKYSFVVQKKYSLSSAEAYFRTYPKKIPAARIKEVIKKTEENRKEKKQLKASCENYFNQQWLVAVDSVRMIDRQ